MIFDIKIEDFRRKARIVAGGHMPGAPTIMTYASEVSCETICIAPTLAALNDLEMKAADILNATFLPQSRRKYGVRWAQNLVPTQTSLPLLSTHSMA
jgi:hypothetical protein